MIYRLDLLSLPIIKAAYTVVRKTVWDIADSQNILILIKEGSCSITTDGTRYILSQGDAIFIPGGHHYKREPINDEMCTLCYVHFVLQNKLIEFGAEDAKKELHEIHSSSMDDFNANKDDFNIPSYTVYLPTALSMEDSAQKAFEIFDETRESQRKDALSRNITASLNLCRLLVRLSNLYTKRLLDGEDKIELPSSRKLRKAITYIQTHISEPISLDTLCGVCHVSKQQLIRYFKSELGTTPIAYINQMKVSRTKEYLQRHPEKSISEVCAELGFDDPLYFSRLFSKIYGESPSKYRHRVRHYTPPKEGNT